MRILVFGPRTWRSYKRVFWVLLNLRRHYGSNIVVVHGGARGVDRFAGRAARELGLEEEIHLPDWSIGKHAGFLRSDEMLDSGIDLAVCIGWGKGTAHTYKGAKQRGITTIYRHITPETP